MPIYDGLAKNLPRIFSSFYIALSLGSTYFFYNYPASYAMDMDALCHWGGLSYFTITTVMLFRYLRQKNTKIGRLFLLQGGQMVRLQFVSGAIMDTPVSTIAQISYNE